MSTKIERRNWILNKMDDFLSELANQVESNVSIANEVASSDVDQKSL